MHFRRLCFGLILLISALPAMAVSLGQVQMQSGLGQPLLAYIPIYEASSYELQNLKVQLAPNDAFRRLGLDHRQYDGVVIEFVEDEDGRSLIQLSTKEAFNEPVFNLLLETKLGNGAGQVKEFTALVDPPFIAKAAIQTIETPTVALTPVVASPLQTPAIQTPAVPTGTTPKSKTVENNVKTPADQPKAGRTAAKQALEKPQNPVKPVAPAAPPPVIPKIPATATNQREVSSGESLYTVSLEHQKRLGDSAISLNQMMTAIQRANSQAFIRGDKNLLKRGSVLRMPDAQQVRALLPDDSANLLNNQWSKAVQAQPAPVLDAANRLASAGAVKPKTSPANPGKTSDANQGRLRIVPTVGNMNNAGSQSGASGAGKGSELRAETGVAQEELVAKQLEITNLRGQLEAANKLQLESKNLIELQNTQIKQLTQRMQEIEKVGNQSETQSGRPIITEGIEHAPWYASPFALLGGLLLIAVLLGFALKRRR